jgi:flap endonuclease-1
MGVDLKGIVTARKIRLEDLAGRTVAVDAYNALYQFLAIIRGEAGEPLADRRGRITSHLSGLFYRNVNFIEVGIKPLYVLDGKPPTLKMRELERRQAVKEEAAAKYQEALATGDLEAARKYAQATAYLKDYMVEDCKRLLTLMGIPWIQAPSEGEATAAYLTQVGLASHVASQDYDSLLFGGRLLVRNMTISGRRKLPGKRVYVEVVPEEISLQALLKELGITREQLVDVGILVGTDFNPDGFKGIGPVKALRYIKKYGRLEDIPEIQDALKSVDYQAIREVFLHPEVAEVKEVPTLEPDYEGILRFLCDERDFSPERVGKALQRMKDALTRRRMSLEQWFG